MDNSGKIKAVYMEFLVRDAQLVNPKLKLISLKYSDTSRFASFVGRGTEVWDDIYLKYGIFTDNHNDAKAKG